MVQDNQPDGVKLSSLARDLAKSLEEKEIDLDALDAHSRSELDVPIYELVETGRAIMQTRDGRLTLRRTALPL